MTIKTTFYILKNEASLKGMALYTCRVIEKAYNNNHKIYIYTNNSDETQNFDRQLWTFRDISFVPHEIYNKDTNTDTQILIGHDTPPTTQNDILVNLSSEITPFHQQFKHIIEIIPNDNKLKTIGRNHFQTYKKQNYQMEVFNIE